MQYSLSKPNVFHYFQQKFQQFRVTQIPCLLWVLAFAKLLCSAGANRKRLSALSLIELSFSNHTYCDGSLPLQLNAPVQTRFKMDAALDQVRDIVEAPIDFQGQQLATKINYILLTLTGVCLWHHSFISLDPN
jgi:hypothetical protein